MSSFFISNLQGAFSAQILQSESEGSKVHEALIGIVTDNKDPLKLGRVKVKIPILSPDDTSWWAPIVMLGAGKNRGWFFIPEKEDEVLVMFQHGDLDFPIVIGALWNGKDTPADKNPGGVPRRTIKSRSGHTIVFDDEKGKIIITDGAKKGQITFDSAANKITIEATEGDVCFQAPTGDIQIHAKEMEMTGKNDNIEIVAGGDMKWGTKTKMTIKGQTVTWSGEKNNENCGSAKEAKVEEAKPADVPDPFTS